MATGLDTVDCDKALAVDGKRQSGSMDIAMMSVVPVPPAVLLFGSALGALGWMRRRKA